MKKPKKIKRHPLKRWRFEYGCSGEELAAMVGINKSYLSEIENRKKEPSLSLANKFVVKTNGAVRFEDFII